MQIGVLLQTQQTKKHEQGLGSPVYKNTYRCPFSKTGTMI